MPYSVEGKLVVAISSRALFDFEEENAVFERDGEPAYIALQFARLDVPARQGVAFPLVKKLLAFNTRDAQRAEVVVLSKNDPVSGLRVFRSAKMAGLHIERWGYQRRILGRPDHPAIGQVDAELGDHLGTPGCRLAGTAGNHLHPAVLLQRSGIATGRDRLRFAVAAHRVDDAAIAIGALRRRGLRQRRHRGHRR